jgi:hypothetical protein
MLILTASLWSMPLRRLLGRYGRRGGSGEWECGTQREAVRTRRALGCPDTSKCGARKSHHA